METKHSNGSGIMSSIQVNKQSNKQTSKEQIIKQTKFYLCLSPYQCSKKRLMKFSAVSAKTWKTLKSLPKMFFNMDAMDLCLR